MFRYGKRSRQAVSAISYLAQRYGRETEVVSSAAVGRARGMSAVLAAKLMSEMATAGLLVGTPGPKGGYRLAMPPEEIRLGDIVRIFEPPQREAPCPFGPGWCGQGPHCPLHDDFLRIQAMTTQFLETTTLAGFAELGPEAGRKRTN
jgi:Rrf2 family protein